MPGASGFSLVDGGPLCALMRRLGWTRPDGHIDYLRAAIVLVAVTWGPLLVATLSARLLTGRSFAIDWSAHTRLLVAIPLLLRSEYSLHARTRFAVVAQARRGFQAAQVVVTGTDLYRASAVIAAWVARALAARASGPVGMRAPSELFRPAAALRELASLGALAVEPSFG